LGAEVFFGALKLPALSGSSAFLFDPLVVREKLNAVSLKVGRFRTSSCRLNSSQVYIVYQLTGS
jgi:hypothetical protein